MDIPPLQISQSISMPTSKNLQRKSKQKTAGNFSRSLPIEQLIDFRLKGLTHNEIGHMLGIARETVSRRLGKVDLDTLPQFKNHEADIIAYHRRRIINSLTPKDCKQATLLQKTTAYGILYDKGRLAEGKSTTNVDIHQAIRTIKMLDSGNFKGEDNQ